MAKHESYNGRKKSNHSLLKLKNVVEKLQKSLTLGRRFSLSSYWETYDQGCREGFDDNEYEDVPEDVKEGHVAVIASEGEEPKRFVIPITYLANPKFVTLLDEAAEEYGFNHVGALPVPCRPSELEKILITC